jgi:hypothetical protein
MHFRDVVLVNIEDPVTKPEVIKLKHKRIQIGGHIPAYSFASYSFRTGQSRYFGTNGSEVYLLNEREMIVQSIDSKESRILGKVQSEIQPRAFDIGSNRALYLRQMNMQRTLDLQIVRFLAP